MFSRLNIFQVDYIITDNAEFLNESNIEATGTFEKTEGKCAKELSKMTFVNRFFSLFIL
jgi:hypothetical protein